MPHYESGLVALRTTDPKLIDDAAKHFRDMAPHPCVELVRADGGKGVWMCFGSFVDTDVSGFLDAKASAKLAKTLKQPIWVGHAIGGYSNFQTAMAFSAEGKRLWSSTFNFAYPPALSRVAEDPFTSPERRSELIKGLRASRGYGRIATEFDIDYFRVLSVDVGDALFAREKRELGKKGAKEHAKWLTGEFVRPEGEPRDGAVPPPAAERVAYRFLGLVDVKEIAGAIAQLAAHLKIPKGAVTVRAKISNGECVLMVGGAGARPLSTTLYSERFVALLAQLSGASLFAYGLNKGEPPAMRAGLGTGAGMEQFMRARREPLPQGGRFKPVLLAASPAAVKKINRLRRELARSED